MGRRATRDRLGRLGRRALRAQPEPKAQRDLKGQPVLKDRSVSQAPLDLKGQPVLKDRSVSQARRVQSDRRALLVRKGLRDLQERARASRC